MHIVWGYLALNLEFEFIRNSIQVHLKKLNMVKKFIFSCNLLKKVNLSDILDVLHVNVKHLKKYIYILMIRAYS